jgi:excisionase family DNA binding protein
MQYNPSEYCSTSDAAKLLGVSLRTVQLWVESGTLQAWKTAGGHRRITMKSVEKLVRDRERQSAMPNVGQPAKQAFKAIIADDDDNMLKVAEVVLSGCGLPLTVDAARDGFEALVKIGESRPDLLITDLSMPGMDGFRMIQTLRANENYRHMAIIVVTGLDDASIKALGLPDDIPVFPKPVSFPRLQEAVIKALGKYMAVAVEEPKM